MRHLLDALRAQVDRRPAAIALIAANGEAWSWRELAASVLATADQLRQVLQSKFTASDPPRIVFQHRNRVEDVLVSLACLSLQCIEIPIDERLPESQKADLTQQANGIVLRSVDVAVSTRQRHASEGNELARACQVLHPTQPSLVLWTSGTTTTPRGVVLSQQNLLLNAQAKLQAVPQSANDHRLTLLSLAHAYARTCDMGTWLLSGCILELGLGRASLSNNRATGDITLINAVPALAPSVLDSLGAQDRRLASLRVFGCGGAALPDQSFHAFKQRNVEVIQGYGCTETSPVICSAKVGDTRPGVVGSFVTNVESDIRQQRLYVRGPCVMLGYLDDEEATQKKIDSSGWLDTGDRVEIETNGDVRILGRADDVVVLSNGFNVDPLPIEQGVLAAQLADQIVVMGDDHGLVIAVKTCGVQEEREQTLATIGQHIESHLPPRTPLRFVELNPPLSVEANELTAKGTVCRHVVQRRFCNP